MTREVLAAWGLAHVEETAVLLVSELVTNAVRHATSTDAITLELEVVQTCLRIEAYRCLPGLALPRTTGEFDESGFEFALVNSLADKWGVRETVTGKTAWAELDVRGRARPPAALIPAANAAQPLTRTAPGRVPCARRNGQQRH